MEKILYLIRYQVRMVRAQRTEEVKEKAARMATERLLDILVPEPKKTHQSPLGKLFGNVDEEPPVEEKADDSNTKPKLAHI